MRLWYSRPTAVVSNDILSNWYSNTETRSSGWVVGSHEVEEVENRLLAAQAKAVVVSVDYRMAPEYKFPYAINDCLDVLKWVGIHNLQWLALHS